MKPADRMFEDVQDFSELLYILASDACRDVEWFPLRYSCYRAENEERADYQEAKSRCEKLGGTLASFQSEDDELFSLSGT